MLHSQQWHLPSPRTPPYLQNPRINIQPCGRRAECPARVHADSDWCQLDWRGMKTEESRGHHARQHRGAATSKRGAKPPDTGGGRLASGLSQAIGTPLRPLQDPSSRSAQSNHTPVVLSWWTRDRVQIQWMEGKMKGELPHTSYITHTCRCAHAWPLVIHELMIQLITDLELLKIISGCGTVSGWRLGFIWRRSSIETERQFWCFISWKSISRIPPLAPLSMLIKHM